MSLAQKASLFALLLFFLASPSTAQKAEIEIPGGRLGEVAFPHAKHHQALQDCEPCHSLFPQREGAIRELKEKGELEERQVMNNCVDCHKDRVRKKLKTGPLRCRGCHIKDQEKGL